jgi:rhodanese-related sulfurtransferase
MARLNQWIEKPVIVICAMGNEAPKIGAKLKEKGFKQILVLKGGIQAWKVAGLPLAKS